MTRIERMALWMTIGSLILQQGIEAQGIFFRLWDLLIGLWCMAYGLFRVIRPLTPMVDPRKGKAKTWWDYPLIPLFRQRGRR